jgi:hypothetical protein
VRNLQLHFEAAADANAHDRALHRPDDEVLELARLTNLMIRERTGDLVRDQRVHRRRPGKLRGCVRAEGLALLAVLGHDARRQLRSQRGEHLGGEHVGVELELARDHVADLGDVTAARQQRLHMIALLGGRQRTNGVADRSRLVFKRAARRAKQPEGLTDVHDASFAL